ncbi:MAG TPA: sortase [Acidimicrobiia bacterium]|jgi:sortase A|nr:sortase [Acidimicrobiia bacterium]
MQEATAEPRPDAAAMDMSLGRRILRAAGWTFIWLGALTLGFVAHQLWVTSYFAELAQTGLAEERLAYYADVEISETEYVPLVEDDQGNLVAGVGGERPTILVEAKPEEGAAFASIRIPRLEELQEGWTIVSGVTIPLLRSGAGHMPTTPLPGQPGNSVISGHRTTYGAPFHNLDVLEPGDLIEVETALGVHVYEVKEPPFVVKPTELWVTEPKPGAWLTLTTCHPKFSAAERLIVQAELVSGPNAAAILGTQ